MMAITQSANEGHFSFLIDFKKGEGDPRRVFDAASLLIEGFQELDATLMNSIDGKINAQVVLDDLKPGSLRVFVSTILKNIDDQGLREGEWKKAVGPALVKAKHLAIEALDKNEAEAPKAIADLRNDLQRLIAQSDVKHLPAYAPIHEGRLIASLEKLQDGKRSLGPKDTLSVDLDGKQYEVDLTKTWTPERKRSRCVPLYAESTPSLFPPAAS